MARAWTATRGCITSWWIRLDGRVAAICVGGDCDEAEAIRRAGDVWAQIDHEAAVVARVEAENPKCQVIIEFDEGGDRVVRAYHWRYANRIVAEVAL